MPLVPADRPEGSAECHADDIRCKQSTMKEDDILPGRSVCEVGGAPLGPAELVSFRVFQQTAEAESVT